jgi:hypothetical protein
MQLCRLCTDIMSAIQYLLRLYALYTITSVTLPPTLLHCGLCENVVISFARFLWKNTPRLRFQSPSITTKYIKHYAYKIITHI